MDSSIPSTHGSFLLFENEKIGEQVETLRLEIKKNEEYNLIYQNCLRDETDYVFSFKYDYKELGQEQLPYFHFLLKDVAMKLRTIREEMHISSDDYGKALKKIMELQQVLFIQHHYFLK